jgi:hypothetical protein
VATNCGWMTQSRQKSQLQATGAVGSA